MVYFSIPSTCSAVVCRFIKQKMGCTLRVCTVKQLWSKPENKLNIDFLELKAVLLALKTAVVSYINKQGLYEIRLSLCCSLQSAVLVQLQANSAKGQTHSRLPKCDSRQTVQRQVIHTESYLLQRGLTPYVSDFTHLRWICSPPSSTTNLPSLDLQSQTKKSGRIWMCMCFLQCLSLDNWSLKC